MVEPDDRAASESVDDSHQNGSSVSRRSRLIVWVLASIAFVAYLVFGSVEARIWRFNRLNFSDRRILDVWRYFGEQLPSMPAQPVFTTLYYGSIVIMVIGTIGGLWFFLSDGDTAPEQTTSHGVLSSDDD